MRVVMVGRSVPVPSVSAPSMFPTTADIIHNSTFLSILNHVDLDAEEPFAIVFVHIQIIDIFM